MAETSEAAGCAAAAGQGAPALASAAPRLRSGAGKAARELAALLGVLLVVGAVALAFAWPWRGESSTAGGAVARYAPIRDGESRLIVRFDPDGTPIGWESQNSRVVPGMRLYTDIRKSPSDAILRALEQKAGGAPVSSSGSLGDVEIVETRTLALGADGQVQNTHAYAYRDEVGDHFVGFTNPLNDQDFVFDPLPLSLPASASLGDRWEHEGTLGGATYQWTGQVIEQGGYAGPLGEVDDCILVETTFMTARDEIRNESRTRERWCAGLGAVESESLDPTTGALCSRLAVVAADGALALPDAAPPAPGLLAGASPATTASPADESSPAADSAQASDPASWVVSRVGRARASGETSEATISPVWLPTDPPVVLAAGYEGDLVAFDATTPGGLIRWSFHPEGTVYSPPAFDPQTGRIFFGASDKRVYALDARGLFLWSFRTGDNVATRPLVADGLVIVASEDDNVYALDAQTGAERWTVRTDGAVVSSPARVGDLVVVGSDDQTVYGLDLQSGDQRWTYAAGGEVEAPIAVGDDGSAFVASRDGTLAAVPAASCADASSDKCEATWEVEPGAALRTAPLVVDDRVLVVDEDGTLVALGRDDGRRLWTVTGQNYVGTPVRVGESIVITGGTGEIHRLGLDGERLGTWTATEAVTVNDADVDVALGPSFGGGSVWLADTNAVVRRLGPPVAGDVPPMQLAWADQATRPPFAQDQLRWTAVEYDGRALVLDYGKRVVALDPATGAGERVATLPGEATMSQIEPVVVGDTLLTIQGETLQAFDLRARRLLWEVPGEGSTFRPPVVAGDVVLWTTNTESNGVLLALDRATGTLRWRVELPSAFRSGVSAAGDLAVVSSPPSAFDLATGTPRWQAALEGAPIGSPALSADGATVYVGTLRQDVERGELVALDAHTGAERWRANLGEAVLSPLERPWVEEGMVVVPSLDGKVIGLEAETGVERWRFGPPVARLGGLTVDRGRAWFMLENARFFVLDVKTGVPAARFTDLELNLNGAGLSQRPLVLGRHVLMPIGLIMLGFDVPEGTP